MEAKTETSNSTEFMQLNSVLPSQIIDMSNNVITSTDLFKLLEKTGLIYRSDFSTWSFSRNGKGVTFEFFIGEEQPVDIKAELCAALVHGQANCPVSLYVNNQLYVQSYNDQDCNWHNKTWTISEEKVHPGWNEIRFVLDPQATTQLFLKRIAVDQAILNPQKIDLSKQQITNAPQLKLLKKSNVFFREDFSTWSFYNKGKFEFEMDICEPLDVTMTLNLCSAIVQGKSNCPINIKINNIEVASNYDDHNPNFHDVDIQIKSEKVKQGKNLITITLAPSATTQMFMRSITVSGE